MKEENKVRYIKCMLLFLAEKFSKNYSSIGFYPTEEMIILLKNSRNDVVEKIVDTFSEIVFLPDNRIAISEISVSEAKYRLNLVAAFISGRHGAVGPLSFTREETEAHLMFDHRKVKIIKINNGAVALKRLKIFFRNLSEEDSINHSNFSVEDVNALMERSPLASVQEA